MGAWVGDCERCGSCCGYELAIVGTLGHAPGISCSVMIRDGSLGEMIKMAYLGKFSEVWDGQTGFEVELQWAGGGPPLTVTIYYPPGSDGLWTSATDKKCPFFTIGTPNVCEIWDKDQIPPQCKSLPKSLSNPLSIGKWGKANPPVALGGNCTIEWIE